MELSHDGHRKSRSRAEQRSQIASLCLVESGIGITLRRSAFSAPDRGVRSAQYGSPRFIDMNRWQATRESVRKRLPHLVELGRKLGIRAGFHNHSGPIVGGTLWDAWEMLEPLDPQWIGVYFDPSHATIEGGKNGWNLGFRHSTP